MMFWGNSYRRTDAFNAGRLFTWGAALVIAGMALPSLRSGSALRLVSRERHSVDARARSLPLAAGVGSVEDRFKTFTTQSRMRAMRAELKMWTQRHGVTPTGALPDIVGANTATDAWGRTVQYLAPTGSSRGWLRSKGANPKTDKDDIWLPLALSDLR